MTDKVLVAYATNAGSTTEVAAAIGETLDHGGAQTDVCRIQEVGDVGGYAAAIVGGPMVLGWHRQAVKFVKRHQEALSQVPVAYFMTALNLTDTGETRVGAVPIFRDPRLPKPPQDPNKLSFKERFATAQSYLEPVLKKAPRIKPVSVAFFKGKLDYSNLNILHMLFVMVVIGATPGDYRDWEAIRDWATSLRPLLLKAKSRAHA